MTASSDRLYRSRPRNAAIRYHASPATINSHSSTSSARKSMKTAMPFTVTVSRATPG